MNSNGLLISLNSNYTNDNRNINVRRTDNNRLAVVDISDMIWYKNNRMNKDYFIEIIKTLCNFEEIIRQLVSTNGLYFQVIR